MTTYDYVVKRKRVYPFKKWWAKFTAWYFYMDIYIPLVDRFIPGYFPPPAPLNPPEWMDIWAIGELNKATQALGLMRHDHYMTRRIAERDRARRGLPVGGKIYADNEPDDELVLPRLTRICQGQILVRPPSPSNNISLV